MAGDFEILGQRLGLECQYVRALRQLMSGGAVVAKLVALALVDGTLWHDLFALAAVVGGAIAKGREFVPTAIRLGDLS